MAVKIIVDSASDYTEKQLEEKGIERVCLHVMFGEKVYTGALEPDLFYKKLLEREHFPTTSQPSPQDFLERYDALTENGDSVVVITISAGLSGTYQSACIAKNMCKNGKNVYVVDSNTAVCGIQLLADEAVRMADEGADAETIAKAIEELKGRVKIAAAIDTFEFLVKGGRVSKLAADIGSLANLKPLITLDGEGRISVWGKALGKAKACALIAKQMLSDEPDYDYDPILVYSHETDNCDKLYEKLVSLDIPVSRDRASNVGATIGTHVGPGAFGVVYIKKA